MLQFLIIVAILAALVLFISTPLRRALADTPGYVQAAQAAHDSDLADLEAAREAKYREIRDAELDHRTGKLSEPDFEVLDAGLRAEAVEIIKAIDAARAQSGATIPAR